MDMQQVERNCDQIWELFRETDREIKEAFRDIARRFQETDKQFQKTDKKFKETDKKFERYFGKLHELDRNWGKLVEALVRPSVAEQFRQRGIPVKGSGQREEAYLDGESMEIDILLRNGDSVILVEVKTTLTVEKVKEHITKRLRRFKEFFPEYHDKKIYGAVAYIHVEEDADRYAYRQGLFALTFTTGDLVTILNDEQFVPKNFG